ncbi:MAG: LysR family transcriptional regulator [SAR202 cluster bacterium]|nr:LysR family transcriptional regulator [SAR202 cluster bacterium]
MELRELRSFVAAARLRSITKAAEELSIGQPTATTHIKKLEQELGTLLFDRIKRPIQLTAAGTTLADLSKPLLDGIDSLLDETGIAEQVSPVRVAATHDIIPHKLLQVVKIFLRIHPHGHLRILSGRRDEVLNMVEEGTVDIGLVPGPERGVDFEFQPLFAYERVLITPLNHPLLNSTITSLDEIASWPLIMMGRGTYTRLMLETEFRRRGLDYEIIVELDSMDMIKRYVALGMGISVGPRLAIDPTDHESFGVVGLAHMLPVEQAGIVNLRGKTMSTPTKAFVQLLRDTLSVS